MAAHCGPQSTVLLSAPWKGGLMIFGRRVYAALAVILSAITLGACATSSPDSRQLTKVSEVVVDAPFADTWQSTKAVLRERELLIYTRDKRGIFVAYTEQERRRFVPQRTQFTIEITEVTPDSTRVTIESAFQVYGVKPLTYPGWHYRPTEDLTETEAILAGIQEKLTNRVAD